MTQIRGHGLGGSSPPSSSPARAPLFLFVIRLQPSLPSSIRVFFFKALRTACSGYCAYRCLGVSCWRSHAVRACMIFQLLIQKSLIFASLYCLYINSININSSRQTRCFGRYHAHVYDGMRANISTCLLRQRANSAATFAVRLRV